MKTPHLWRSLEESLSHPDLRSAKLDGDPRADADAFVPRPATKATATRGSASIDAEEAVPPRRTFLQVMGTMLAMGAGCTKQPEERIVPHVNAPEGVVPGKPLFYASATVLGGVATGVLVEQNEGRPTKLEGNPEHPASLGATDAFTQAEVFSLYDPARSTTLTHLGAIAGWGELVGVLQKALISFKSKQGAGLRILTGNVGSPTLARQIGDLLKAMPKAKWHAFEPVARESARVAAKAMFGKDVEPRYDLGKADVAVMLDADLFGTAEGRLVYARQFASRRTPDGKPLRLYAFEPTPSITGTRADHRYRVRAGSVGLVAQALAAAVGVQGIGPAASPVAKATIDTIAKDLLGASGRSVVAAGDFQPPAVHRLAAMINQALGNVGKTVTYGEPALFGDAEQTRGFGELCGAMQRGEVELLLILGTNPVYDAPADFGFERALQKVPLRVHLGLYDDETAGNCHWHVPEAHTLEAWSDGRAYDGTVSVIQPLIAPLYGGKSAHEILVAFSDKPEATARDLVRETATQGLDKAAAEGAFRRALNAGVSRAAPAPIDVGAPKVDPVALVDSGDLEIVYRPDASMYDGRFASNAWLCEMPRPMTKMTWDNAAMISPEDAKARGLVSGSVVDLIVGGRRVRAPVWVLPGQAKGSIAVHLGYGRKRGSKIGVNVGFDAYAIREAKTATDAEVPLWHRGGLTIEKASGSHEFATTQGHHTMEGRDIVRSARFGDGPSEKFEEDKKHLSLWSDRAYTGYAWGMTIDLGTCLGCNACAVACHAENNVPVVGKEQVINGREMHWIRIDRYYEGSEDDPTTHFQPVPCMQCEQAPCEVVCPVQATTHSDEGLNDMVYNRCVGTKYCSNNCPYKVRRYNFFGFSVDDVFGLDMKAPSVALMHNPDVTVRSYGVMEKCTYCVQRIVGARIEAKKQDRPIRDGEVMTACQAACPTRAITFGDIHDAASEVAKKKAEERNYPLLAELNTKPRTTYLAALWNPHPGLPDSALPGSGEKKKEG